MFGALIGGLFGPIGIVAYPLVFSAPAWIALGITALVQRGPHERKAGGERLASTKPDPGHSQSETGPAKT